LSGAPFTPADPQDGRQPDALDLGAVRERANYLLASIAAVRANALPPEHAAVLLAALRPIEEAIARLRSATPES
jgi:hypothetical protein